MRLANLAKETLQQKIYEDIRQKIATGEFRYMQPIPALPDLCRIYGVSEAPVRKALDELEHEGFVLKKRGKGYGTIVTKRLTQYTIRTLLVADVERQYSAIETYHEVLEIMLGIVNGATLNGCKLEQMSMSGFHNAPTADASTGYLVLAMSWNEYRQGLELATSQGSPCVFVNPPGAGYPSVRVDMERGAYIGVNYLVQLGHRRIAYVGRTDTEWSRPRFEGYMRACKEAGIPFDPTLIKQTNGVLQEEDWRALDELMNVAERPGAIFASSDYRAMHLLARCKQRGIKVPQELSICGYDDISESTNIQPALTTVQHPRHQLGKLAVEMLVAMLDGLPNASEERVVGPKLMMRETCTTPRRLPD